MTLRTPRGGQQLGLPESRSQYKRQRGLWSNLCSVGPLQSNVAHLRESALWTGGQLRVAEGDSRAAVILDRPTYAILIPSLD